MIQLQRNIDARDTTRETDDVCWRFSEPGSVCFHDLSSPFAHPRGCQIYGNLWLRLTNRFHCKGWSHFYGFLCWFILGSQMYIHILLNCYPINFFFPQCRSTMPQLSSTGRHFFSSQTPIMLSSIGYLRGLSGKGPSLSMASIGRAWMSWCLTPICGGWLAWSLRSCTFLPQSNYTFFYL